MKGELVSFGDVAEKDVMVLKSLDTAWELNAFADEEDDDEDGFEDEDDGDEFEEFDEEDEEEDFEDEEDEEDDFNSD